MKKVNTFLVLLILVFSQISLTLAQENWSLKWERQNSYKVWIAHFSPDGEKIITNDYNNDIKLLNVEDGSIIWTYPLNSAWLADSRFSPDGKYIAYALGSEIFLLDAVSSNLIKTFTHSSVIVDFKFNPDGLKITAADQSGLKVWDINSGNALYTVPQNSTISALILSNDGSKILTLNLDKSLNLWNSANGDLLWTQNFSNFDNLSAWAFQPGDDKIICGFQTKLIELNTSDGSTIWEKNYEGRVESLNFIPDGAKFVFKEGYNIRSSNTSDGSEIWKKSSGNQFIILSPDGNRIASSGLDSKIRIWDSNTGNLLRTESHSNVINALEFSPNSKNLVSGSDDKTMKLLTREKSVKLISPSSGQRLKNISTFDITWTSLNINNVKIEYSADSATTWSTIVDNTPASNETYNWTIPKTPSKQSFIRISDSDSLEINDTNDEAFEIFQPIIITSPNGLEVWKGGTNQNITWLSDSVSSVSISYTSDNGNHWNSIATNIPAADESYSWLVPYINSSQCKILIFDSNNTSINDDSDNLFAIYKDLELTSPNGGETWEINTLHNISWTSKTTADITIELSTDNGISWSTVVKNVSANTGNYVYLVPNIPSQQCKVRIFDVNNSNIIDESDSVFVIYNKSLALISPNGGEELKSGKMYSINWTSEYVNNIKIEFTSDNGNSWTSIVTSTPASNKTYSMKVPSTTSTNCKIRITDVDNSKITDESDTVFSVYQPVISVTSPTGGEIWFAGATQQITWISDNVENVKIEFTTDGGLNWQTIIESTSAASWSYDFVVPGISSKKCKVRISDITDSQIKDESSNPFTIANPSISVTSPNGGENWVNGETKEIKWTSIDVENIKIEYTTDNGAAWLSVVNNISADLTSYFWTVPDIVSSLCKIKISNVDNTEIFDESDGLFEMSAPVGVEDEIIPTKFALLQSYPNPFNPTTTISFDLPSETFVSLKVFNSAGEEVSTLVNGVKAAGRYKLEFSGENLSSGIYFYVLRTENFTKSKKMILLK